MCYSAQVEADYLEYCRLYGAEISIGEFFELFVRVTTSKLKVPKAMEAAFSKPATDVEAQIKLMLDDFRVQQATEMEQELFAQKRRLADAERKLQTKVTKAATESKRIAESKAERLLGRLADLRRDTLLPRDSRIFPGWYAPVLVSEGGARVVRPMRYQCRPCGKPAFYDDKYPGTYNARRDNLEGFWKGQFGYTHGVIMAEAFYENVDRHDLERRLLADGEKPENVVLEFRPQPAQVMLLACLWSRWSGPGEPDLLSFAAITDDPPPEVAAAGHDRCVIPIKPENLEAWLNPDPSNLASLYAILDDRPRPYYQHKALAA